jgi:hypothetical protein
MTRPMLACPAVGCGRGPLGSIYKAWLKTQPNGFSDGVGTGRVPVPRLRRGPPDTSDSGGWKDPPPGFRSSPVPRAMYASLPVPDSCTAEVVRSPNIAGDADLPHKSIRRG